MSHSYHLRPTKGRVQRQLDTHVAAPGQQNRDKIVAVPSDTGEGVHLHSDPERPLFPQPDQANQENVVVLDDSDELSSLSDLESDSDTVAPDTPSTRGQFLTPSYLHAPKASRYMKLEIRSEGSVESDSSSVNDSLAPQAERLNAHMAGENEGLRRGLEQEHQKILEQVPNNEASNRVNPDTMERYFGSIDQQWLENLHGFPNEANQTAETPLPMFPPPESAPGPSRLGQGTVHRQKDRKQQRYTPLRRHNARQLAVSPRDKKAGTKARSDDRPLVVVARRVQKLGPCGTVVLDHKTGEDKVVTKCYTVREDELHSIDGDGDSDMGSDEEDD